MNLFIKQIKTNQFHYEKNPNIKNKNTYIDLKIVQITYMCENLLIIF